MGRPEADPQVFERADRDLTAWLEVLRAKVEELHAAGQLTHAVAARQPGITVRSRITA